jgi:hypothetical protein
MTNRYKIIWIDDQFDEQESFIDQAERDGLNLIPFKTSREGMDYLHDNLLDVDAVILDAKVFKDRDTELASTKGLRASLDELARISGQNKLRDIPHVIFTGQPDLFGNSAFEDLVDGVPIFSKLQPNEYLFQKLRELIGESESATIRNRYPLAYLACEWMAGNSWRLLFPILNSMETGAELVTDPYNDLRKVLEYAFRKLYDVGILHERLIDNGMVNIQGSSLFLAGMEVRFISDGTSIKAKSAVIPKLVSEQIRFVLGVCQVGSHTEGNQEIPVTKPSISEVEKWNKAHHLLEIATLMTMDLIVWAKAYVDENPDAKVNMKNWEPINQNGNSIVLEVEGIIDSINRQGNAFVKTDHLEETERRNISIASWLINNNELTKGMRVRVTTSGRVLENGALAATSYTSL